MPFQQRVGGAEFGEHVVVGHRVLCLLRAP
jgi:hypothetical protein